MAFYPSDYPSRFGNIVDPTSPLTLERAIYLLVLGASSWKQSPQGPDIPMTTVWTFWLMCFFSRTHMVVRQSETPCGSLTKPRSGLACSSSCGALMQPSHLSICPWATTTDDAPQYLTLSSTISNYLNKQSTVYIFRCRSQPRVLQLCRMETCQQCNEMHWPLPVWLIVVRWYIGWSSHERFQDPRSSFLRNDKGPGVRNVTF